MIKKYEIIISTDKKPFDTKEVSGRVCISGTKNTVLKIKTNDQKYSPE